MKIHVTPIEGRYVQHWTEGHVRRQVFAREVRRVVGCDRRYLRGIFRSTRHVYDEHGQPLTVCDHVPTGWSQFNAVQSWDEHGAMPYLALGCEQWQVDAVDQFGERVRRVYVTAGKCKSDSRNVERRFVNDMRDEQRLPVRDVRVSYL